ncbi:hypothetical protein [Ignavigranum ruoffiae]|uniref:hypothetical protein n=1 Tax=Ignavigranum ruoffiae TaxID=89093 RepID=UPI0024AD2B78|nr:hypothetical protein [Ignavigranum ruoffiae]
MQKCLIIFCTLFLVVGCDRNPKFNPKNMQESIIFMEETFEVESSISDEKDYQTNELVKLIGLENLGFMVASSKEEISYIHFYPLNLEQAEDILNKFGFPISPELKTNFHLSKNEYERFNFAEDEVFYKYKDYAVQATRDRNDPSLFFLTLIFNDEYIRRYDK